MAVRVGLVTAVVAAVPREMMSCKNRGRLHWHCRKTIMIKDEGWDSAWLSEVVLVHSPFPGFLSLYFCEPFTVFQ
jgi:hypothetical protein